LSAGSQNDASEQSVPGWFGKLPALGDFASRRLSSEFIAEWDAWLQRSLAASRRQLGERWLELYLTSPIWRFALLSRACGPDAWAGVLMPSVDNVGRYFPLTIALPLGESLSSLRRIGAAEAWYASVEEVALSALDDRFTIDALEERLAQLPFPSDAPPADDAIRLADWWGEPAEPLALIASRAVCAALADAALGAMAATGTGRTLWWANARGESSSCVLGYVGLPGESEFAVMMTALAQTR
jgi:type VI secretion system protein ImpM